MADAAVQLSLSRALDEQRAGRYDNAIAGYDSVLANAPGHFDALHMRGVAHFQRGTFDAALADLDRAGALRPGDAALRFNRQLVVNAIARRPVEIEIARLARSFRARMDAAPPVARPVADPVRVIAFFLPQFHRIAENDRWWGEGFTEWTNVRRARPNFVGHLQPHVPGELGWYDLTDPDVRAKQAALAREHGIDAFCYYHYWFGGKRLLEAPLDAVLASGQPDFPFCLCWANENWTRRWDGLDHEILIEQRHGADDARAFVHDLVPYLTDRRYVRVNGRPLLVIYKPAAIPDLAPTVAAWRDAARDAGLGEIYLVAVARNGQDDPTPHGFDAAIEFPPIGHTAELINARLEITNPEFQGAVFEYRNLMADYLLRPRPAYRQFRGVTPMWDNTARRQNTGMILAGSRPEDFGVWLEHALRQTRQRHAGDERLLFVNAWNEWAEGNHLEPDAAHGRAYLEAVRTARRIEHEPPRARPPWADVERDTVAAQASGAIQVRRFAGTSDASPPSAVGGAGRGSSEIDRRVSVVMPVFNHAGFLPRALASLAEQSALPFELVAVDDGSRDDSARIIATFAATAPFPVTLVIQENAGAHIALNRGMALARGPIIALINSDDAYAPRRLEMLVAAIDDRHLLAFSGMTPVDADDRVVDTPYARELVARVAEVSRLPHLLFALIRHNPAVSTGNLVFRRSLLHATGGFASFRICHDWDFLLAAALATEPAFVPAPLYFYRLHDANTFAASTLAGHAEGDEVLASFLAAMGRHPWLAIPAQRASLLAFAREAGLGGNLTAFAR
jgi:GT2 family glycosyltransferase